jgi:hypothetical protein
MSANNHNPRVFRVAAVLLYVVILHLFVSIPLSSAMKMNNMLMAQTLEAFLSALVSFGSMSLTEKDDILLMSLQFNPDYDPSIDDVNVHQQNVFSTEESKQALRTYLYKEVDRDFMEYETAEVVASMLSLGTLYPRDAGIDNLVESNAASMLFGGPAGSSYSGEGNIVRLAKNSIFGIANATSGVIYNGIWGYAAGEIERILVYYLLALEFNDLLFHFKVQGSMSCNVMAMG